MPDIDPQLAAALKAAKKKPHNFIYVIGSKDKVLVLAKGKVSAGDIKEAREQAGGSVVIKGICRGDGSDGLVFETATKTGGTFEKQVKASIKMQAGLKIPATATHAANPPEQMGNEQEKSEKNGRKRQKTGQ